MKQIVDDSLRDFIFRSEKAISSLQTLTKQIDSEELHRTVSDILDRIRSPFTFVIVGEVKAGKSSFVNALLESQEEICKVAPSPMTDTIQLITYGDQHGEEMVNEHYKRITQPIEILKSISIVDTPGTNTIEDHHQEITERFIPHSDLIVFVFEAKNPYRQSAWQFFDYINEEWRRKVIFVLQQKDLMNTEDLQTNIQGVIDNAKKKGISEPLVYAVSAKMELENQKDESGFSKLRTYIAENITNGKAPFLKIKNNVVTVQAISEKISSSLDLRYQQFEYDKAFRDEIKAILSQQEGKTKNQIKVLVENLLATYDRITNVKIQKLSEGLGFFSVIKRSVSSVFGSKESLKAWLDAEAKDFEYNLNNSLKQKLSDGIIDVADNIQTMGKLVHSKIRDSKTILEDSDEIFADIAEKRAKVLEDLQRGFSDFMNKSENFYAEDIESASKNVGPNLAAGSGIAAIGVILAAITNGAVFDITGGILTTVGVLFAGVSLGLKRNKILKGFKKEIANGRTRIEFDVQEKLDLYTERIKHRIDDNFYQLDLLLNHEEKTLQGLRADLSNVSESLEKVESDVVGML